MRLSDKHHSVTSCTDVNEICKDLFDYSGINTFLYARVYDDHTTYGVTNRSDWHMHHFQQEYMAAPPVPPHIIANKFFFIPPPITVTPFQQAIDDFINIFDMGFPMIFVERYVGYFELFFFATSSKNHSILNFYLNNIDVLEKFKFYFKDKAERLLKESKKHKIIMPQSMWPTFGGLEDPTARAEEKLELTRRLQVRRFMLKGEHDDVYLTKKRSQMPKESHPLWDDERHGPSLTYITTHS